MWIILYKRFFFILSGVLVLLSIASIAVFGLSLSHELTGGVLIEVRYEKRPAAEAVYASLEAGGIEGSLREVGEMGYTLRTGALTDAQRTELPALFSVEGGEAEITQLTEIGPSLGKELRGKAIIALLLVMLCIILFVAFAFRQVSKTVSSFLYGLIVLLTLGFDVIVPVGFFAALGHFTGAQVDALFITATLTILGYSVHDTIVVFDRTRENVRRNEERSKKEPFAETAGRALSQTLARSINTSLTTALVLVALVIFGPASTTVFALMLLVGIIVGTYSSIFLATPLLVAVSARSQK
jgi:preprotein translocase subunit SecF